MVYLIDKDALVAEIERLRKNQRLDDRHGQRVLDGLHAIERFVDTFEVKEANYIWRNARTTVPEGRTNQIICIKEDGLAVSTVGKIVNGTVKWAYLDDLLKTNSLLK